MLSLYNTWQMCLEDKLQVYVRINTLNSEGVGLIPAAAMYIPQLPTSSRSVQQATWEPNLTKTDLKITSHVYNKTCQKLVCIPYMGKLGVGNNC